jgi:hypothetical protein
MCQRKVIIMQPQHSIELGQHQLEQHELIVACVFGGCAHDTYEALWNLPKFDLSTLTVL